MDKYRCTPSYIQSPCEKWRKKLYFQNFQRYQQSCSLNVCCSLIQKLEISVLQHPPFLPSLSFHLFKVHGLSPAHFLLDIWDSLKISKLYSNFVFTCYWGGFQEIVLSRNMLLNHFAVDPANKITVSWGHPWSFFGPPPPQYRMTILSERVNGWQS